MIGYGFGTIVGSGVFGIITYSIPIRFHYMLWNNGYILILLPLESIKDVDENINEGYLSVFRHNPIPCIRFLGLLSISKCLCLDIIH